MFCDSLRLVFRRSGDIAKERKQLTPSRGERGYHLDRFLRNWKNVDLAGKKVLSQKARDDLNKLKVHVEKDCLEDIPPKAGISRQEYMHIQKPPKKRIEKKSGCQSSSGKHRNVDTGGYAIYQFPQSPSARTQYLSLRRNRKCLEQD